MILHLSNDLMLVGKVSAWAKTSNIDYKNASSMKKLDQLLADETSSVVVVDLQFRSLDISGIADRIRDADSDIKLYGYAQHVMTDLIESAKDANFDAVLTRGQFDRGFMELMA